MPRSRPPELSAASVRIVLDTNVIVAGLLWRGPPHVLLEQVRAGSLRLILSPVLQAELSEVIRRPKFDAILARGGVSRERLLAEFQHLAERIEPHPLPEPRCRDPDDDHVLALAIAGKADLIVSGDDDLLSMRDCEGIPILAPAEAVAMVRAGP